MRARGAEIHERTKSLHDPQAAFDAHLPTLSAWRAVAAVLAESPDADDRWLARRVVGFLQRMSVVVISRTSKNADATSPLISPRAPQSEIPSGQESSPDIEH
jgi:hypothetical protein